MFEPVYGDFDNSWTYPNADAARRRAAAQGRASPLAPRNDAETKATKDEGGDEGRATRDEGRRTRARRRARRGEGRRSKKDESKPKRRRCRIQAAPVDDRSRRLRGARGRAAAQGRQLRADLQREGQAPLPPRAADRLGRREEPRSSSSTSRSARRRRSSTMPTAFEVTADGKKALVRRDEEVRDRRDQEGGEVREAAAHRRHGGDRRSARRVAADVRRRLSLRARLLLRPEHARRRLEGDARSLRGAAGRCGHALGRELRARRVHRRAERVAHLSRRRRRGGGARARRRHARRRLGARERRLPHQAHRRAAARGTPTCARPSPSPAPTSRSATTSSP